MQHYPGPDRSVRLEELRAGRALPRRYRNRRIGEFLKELDMTEGRSTGIPKILHAMADNGSPSPIFDFDKDHSYFMCRLPVHPQATMPEGLTGQGGERDNVLAMSALDHIHEALGQATGQVTGQVASKVLMFCKDVRSSKEIQKLLGLKHRETFLNNYLKPLLNSKWIEMSNPDSPKSPAQKYQITREGKKALEAADAKQL